jgi:molybdopterin-guanine dinucleotide biosynthesis protein A
MVPVRSGPPRFPDCTGVLLAGGAATRLGGVPKGLLRVAGEPIVARSLRLFGELFAESILVANDPAPYAGSGARIVADLVPGKGAPGGLHAALSHATTPWVFLAACDMPFLAAGPIAWLAERRGASLSVTHGAVAVVWKGRLEPLHAFWSRSALPSLDAALRTGDPSMWGIATSIGTHFVAEAEWREIDPDGRAFANVNTPEDAARFGVHSPARPTPARTP